MRRDDVYLMKRPKQWVMLSGILAALAIVIWLAVSVDGRISQSPARTLEALHVSNNSGCKIGSLARRVQSSITRLGLRVEKSATVVGCGRRAGENLIVVAYVASGSMCTVVERRALGSIQGGACKPATAKWIDACPEACFSAEGTDPRQKGKYRRTFASAVAPAPVSSVEMVKVDGSSQSQTHPLVVEVAGKLLQRFNQDEPFDVVTTLLAECISPRRLRVSITLLQDQKVLSARGLKLQRYPCNAPS